MADSSPLSGPVERFDRATLERLRDGAFPESRTLDYKQGDPCNDPSEFQKDVTAFANTDGGHLLYGVTEDRATSAPTDFPGFDAPEPEKVIRRLNDILRGNVEPRLRDPEYQWIDVGNGKRVLVVRVARSWSAPHAARRSLPFYKRSSNASPPMDVHELRSAILAAGQAEDRFREFCDRRVRAVMGEWGRPSAELMGGLKSVVHVAPLSALVGAYRLDVSEHHATLGELVPGRHHDGALVTRRPNLDGYLSVLVGGEEGKTYSYLQAFRSGAIEGVCVWEKRTAPGSSKTAAVINAAWLEKTVINDVSSAVAFYKALGIGPPVFVRHTIVDGNGFVLQTGHAYSTPHGRPISETVMAFPDLAAEDWPANVAAFLRPSFDAFWNVFGLRCSQNFDEQGGWFDPSLPRS